MDKSDYLFKGLNHLTELVNLNLSNNYISCLSNLAHLPNLQTLTLTRYFHRNMTRNHQINYFRNKLATADDIKELEGCLAVTSLGKMSESPKIKHREANKFLQTCHTTVLRAWKLLMSWQG